MRSALPITNKHWTPFQVSRSPELWGPRPRMHPWIQQVLWSRLRGWWHCHWERHWIIILLLSMTLKMCSETPKLWKLAVELQSHPSWDQDLFVQDSCPPLNFHDAESRPSDLFRHCDPSQPEPCEFRWSPGLPKLIVCCQRCWRWYWQQCQGRCFSDCCLYLHTNSTDRS